MKKENHSSLEGLTASQAKAAEKRTAPPSTQITALAVLTLSSGEDDKNFPTLVLTCYFYINHVITSHCFFQHSSGTGKYSVYAAIYQKVKNFPFQSRERSGRWGEGGEASVETQQPVTQL